MKFCSKCGSKLSDDATFCSSCGCMTESAQPPSINVTQTQTVQKTGSKFGAKHIILIVVAVVVVVGVIFGMRALKIKKISDALAGNSYMYSDYTLYTLTDLTFTDDGQCEYYKYFAYTDNTYEYTVDYSIRLDGSDAYVEVQGKEYEVVMSGDTATALIEVDSGNRYD